MTEVCAISNSLKKSNPQNGGILRAQAGVTNALSDVLAPKCKILKVYNTGVMSVEIRMTNEKIIQVTACYGKVNNILVNWKTMEEIKKGKKPKTVERVFVSNYEIDASKEELKFIDGKFPKFYCRDEDDEPLNLELGDLERIKKFCMAVIFAWENIKISENFKIS